MRDAHADRGRRFGEYQSGLVQVFSDYRFVFAFEATDAPHAVGPTVLTALRAGAIPVFRGTADVTSWLPDSSAAVILSGPREQGRSLRKGSSSSSSHDGGVGGAAKAAAATLVALNDDLPRLGQTHHAWREQAPRKWARSFFEKLDHCVGLHPECRLCEAVARIQQRLPNVARAHGAAARAAREGASALSLDGKAGYADAGNYAEAALGSVTGQFTIAAWIYLDDITDRRIVDKNKAGEQSAFGIDIISSGKAGDGRGFLRICGMGGCHSGMKPLSKHKWYHIAVSFITFDAANALGIPFDGALSFYVNGELDYRSSYIHLFRHPPVPNKHPLRIGRAGEGDNFFAGKIDDVSLWDIALPLPAIQRLMFQRLGGREPGLVSYWGFNEGDGSTARDAAERAHARLEGGAEWVSSETKDLNLAVCG